MGRAVNDNLIKSNQSKRQFMYKKEESKITAAIKKGVLFKENTA